MPVDSPHPEYVGRVPQWARCRDAIAGGDAIKGAGESYLPRLTDMDPADYDAYKRRAMFYSAAERTVQGLTGLVLRKPPTMELPASVEDDLVDLTLTGEPWDSVLLQTIDEVIAVGRVGILIDWNDDAGRAAWTLYTPEAIINWRLGVVSGPDEAPRVSLTRVVLAESVTIPDPKDPFVEKTVPQYRVFELVPIGARGAATHRLEVSTWRRTDEAAAWPLADFVETGTETPERNGQPVPAIPFVVIGPRRLGITPEKPPILDLVDVNLSHYRSSADLEHGRHFTALPTPWISGFTAPIPVDGDAYAYGPSTPKAMKIGSGEAWVFRDPNTSVGMLEFTGTGLASLVIALEHKEKLMAILGARLLEGQAAHGETAEAVRLRHSGESATLTTVVHTLDEGLTLAFRWHAWWERDESAFAENAPINVQLNKDFFEAETDASSVKQMVDVWQSGGMAYKTLYQWLERAEMTREGVTAEEELADIEREQAAMAEQQTEQMVDRTQQLVKTKKAALPEREREEDDEEAETPIGVPGRA
jgi:hypothetical protein